MDRRYMWILPKRFLAHRIGAYQGKLANLSISTLGASVLPSARSQLIIMLAPTGGKRPFYPLALDSQRITVPAGQLSGAR